MDQVCPICNGLCSYIVECPKCKEGMISRGTIQDYFDDYSPYLSMEITEDVDGVSSNECLHVFYCERCGGDKRVPIQRITI